MWSREASQQRTRINAKVSPNLFFFLFAPKKCHRNLLEWVKKKRVANIVEENHVENYSTHRKIIIRRTQCTSTTRQADPSTKIALQWICRHRPGSSNSLLHLVAREHTKTHSAFLGINIFEDVSKFTRRNWDDSVNFHSRLNTFTVNLTNLSMWIFNHAVVVGAAATNWI